MMTNSSAATEYYDETQFGYIRLQSAVQLLDYLAGLYVDELPSGTSQAPCAVRRLTTALEAELRLYVGEIAPDLLPPLRKAQRGVSYVRPPRQAFTGGRPKARREERLPEGSAGRGATAKTPE